MRYAAQRAGRRQYAQLQQTEAAGRVQDLEQVVARLNELDRQRAEGWREVAHDLRGNLGILKNVATELLDARLELQTEPGKGTTFRVMFPLRYTEN